MTSGETEQKEFGVCSLLSFTSSAFSGLCGGRSRYAIWVICILDKYGDLWNGSVIAAAVFHPVPPLKQHQKSDELHNLWLGGFMLGLFM